MVQVRRSGRCERRQKDRLMAASQYYFSNSRIVLELIRRSDDSETTAVNDFCCVSTGPDVLVKS